jgi:hypothetical protein
MAWTPPWRSPLADCATCGNTVAASTLDAAGRCVTCVARPPEPEKPPEPEPEPLFSD